MRRILAYFCEVLFARDCSPSSRSMTQKERKIIPSPVLEERIEAQEREKRLVF